MSSRFRTQFAFIIWKCLYVDTSNMHRMCYGCVCIFALWCLIPLQIDNVDFWLINRLWLTHVCFEPWSVEKSTKKMDYCHLKWEKIGILQTKIFVWDIICKRYWKSKLNYTEQKKILNQSLTKFSFFSPSLSSILYEWPISTMTTKWLR